MPKLGGQQEIETVEEFNQTQLEPPAEPEIPIVATPGGAVLEEGEFASPNYVPNLSGWKINSDGEAEFTDVIVNGSSLALSPFFGDGSDGDLIMSANETLTEDKYYNDVVVNSGYTLNTNGYRLFVKGTLINHGTITPGQTNGGAGGDGGAPGAGAAGAAGSGSPVGYFPASTDGVVGKAGGAGGAGGGAGANGVVGGNGNAGVGPTLVANAGKNSGAGGDSGEDGGGHPGAPNTGGAGATGGATGVAASYIPKNLTECIPLIDFGNLAALTKYSAGGGSGASGGSGAGGPSDSGSCNGGGGGGSGGSGAHGGIMLIAASVIKNTSSGVITCAGGGGGNGGNGGNASGSAGNAGGGGGGAAGAGGNGGVLVLAYRSLTNNGSILVTSGSGGSAGTGGSGFNSGTAGTAGATGVDGTAGLKIELQA